ncbi:MAG: hypothetical protein KKB59_11195, partial [Spirochaetes bacterium]|nr:hypothetical protein [Spirochaetota bacterium]
AQKNGAIVACGYYGSSVYVWENGAVSTFTAPDGYARAYPRAISLDGDTTYLVGYVYSSVADTYAPCTWKNGVPSIMGTPPDPSIIKPYSAAFVDGELVATGQCYVKNGDDDVQVAGYWKSGAWIPLPIPSGSTGARAFGTTPDANVFTGYATLQNGATQPGYWEAGAWHALSLPNGAAGGYARVPLTTEARTPEPARDSGKLAVYTAGAFDSNRPIMDQNGALMYDQYEADYTTEVESFKASFATSIYLDGNDIFFAGNSTDGGAAYWKNGIRTDLAVPAGTFSRTATDIAVSESNVYVAGYFKKSSAGEIPCLWVNGTISELEIGGTLGGEANRLAIVGSDVYVSGYYVEKDEAGADNDTWKICFWKNGIRTDLESVTGLPSITVFGLAQSGPDVYLCGSSGIPADPGRFAPAYWLVSGATLTKTTLDIGSAEKAGLVGLVVEGSSVYATGAFYNAGTGWMPAIWKNGLMSALETDNTQTNNFQTGIAVAVDGSDVYVAGMRSYSYKGEVPTLWKNGEIVPLADGTSYGSMMDVAIRRY